MSLAVAVAFGAGVFVGAAATVAVGGWVLFGALSADLTHPNPFHDTDREDNPNGYRRR